jgi:predicted 3-demethylubiquinone-9 3-methyltransferase (glyoxalase superfamily)
VDGLGSVTGKITPFLWFDGKAEDAANFYVSIFDNAKILEISRYPEGSPGPAGTVMTVQFELDGQPFIALNGGPLFTFTPAISFSIDCNTQAEVDKFWERLSEGGSTNQCGWLQDKYGISWQVVPSVLPKLLKDDDAEKSDAVMQAMLKMTKLDIKALQDAYDGVLTGGSAR